MNEELALIFARRWHHRVPEMFKVIAEFSFRNKSNPISAAC
jgi:hypothetical protein